jgi:cytochrome c oxidase subunit III
MSTVESNVADSHGNGDATHAHDPHLAHHFDTPEQQFQSAKLGMWVFLGTELLMFGGLFCAYSVYRHNHPDVFAYAHQALDRPLGAVNTLVLITSSLTMAWGVRAAQLGGTRALRWLLAATLLGGFMFLGIKAIEYHTKWEHQLFFGSSNHFYGWNGQTAKSDVIAEELEGAGEHKAPGAESQASPGGEKHIPGENATDKGKNPDAAVTVVNPTESSATTAQPAKPAAGVVLPPGGAFDPNAGTADQAKITANWADPKGLSDKLAARPEAEMKLDSLTPKDRKRIYTFFAVYFFMTGLHGVHVLVGMALIYWILLRASGERRRLWMVPAAPIAFGLFFAYLGIVIGSVTLMIIGITLAVVSALWALLRYAMHAKRLAADEGEFGPEYFTPVDLVGLYWHLVDLIWIFLFPLLYLIH